MCCLFPYEGTPRGRLFSSIRCRAVPHRQGGEILRLHRGDIHLAEKRYPFFACVGVGVVAQPHGEAVVGHIVAVGMTCTVDKRDLFGCERFRQIVADGGDEVAVLQKRCRLVKGNDRIVADLFRAVIGIDAHKVNAAALLGRIEIGAVQLEMEKLLLFAARGVIKGDGIARGPCKEIILPALQNGVGLFHAEKFRKCLLERRDAGGRLRGGAAVGVVSERGQAALWRKLYRDVALGINRNGRRFGFEDGEEGVRRDVAVGQGQALCGVAQKGQALLLGKGAVRIDGQGRERRVGRPGVAVRERVGGLGISSAHAVSLALGKKVADRERGQRLVKQQGQGKKQDKTGSGSDIDGIDGTAPLSFFSQGVGLREQRVGKIGRGAADGGLLHDSNPSFCRWAKSAVRVRCRRLFTCETVVPCAAAMRESESP